MKKILVPTDFSKAAENALKVAAQLARRYDCEIYLMHMLEIPFQEMDALSSQSALPEAMFFIKLAQQRFEEVKSRDYLQGLTVHETVKPNSSFNAVIDSCQENNVDMIVMGSHGASGLKEMFVGSNAEKVVRNSHIPVLVIKNEHVNFTVDNFVFASDFKMDSKETYKQAIDIAEMFDAKIHLLMVNTPNSFSNTTDAKNRIMEFIKDYTFENYTMNVFNDESVEKGILDFSREIDADLIGISTHGRQGIAHFFNGSISEDLVNHSQRPVITFKI